MAEKNAAASLARAAQSALERLSEGELRKILLEQQAILDNATVGILFSRDRKLIASNALCAEIFGYTMDEFIGLPGVALYPSEEVYQEMGLAAVPTLAAGLAFRTEAQFKRKDGSLIWCRVSAKAIDPEHPQDSTIWIIEDATSDRAMREALEQSVRELGAIFDTATIGIVMLRERRIARCNRRMEELFGYASGEMDGLSTRSWYFSDEEFAEVGASAYPDLMQDNMHQRERQFRRKDGTSFWGRLSSRAFDQMRPLLGAVCLIEDVTEKKLAEERVRDALEEQEMIFNNAAVAILFVRNRVIQRCNHRLEALFGYSEGELVGNSTLLLFPTVGEYDEFGARIYEMIGRGQTVVGELRMRCKDGRLLWLRATGRRTDSPGPGLDLIWILEDVTERRLAEEALARAHEELEQRVVERTAELASTNVQLQEEIHERLQAEQRIWHMAHHDTLTGLPNRSLLYDRLDQALTQARRARHRLAVMFLDLDRFKSINDTLGHAIGDELLKEVAARLRGAVRASDTVARLGGDEFVVVLHEIERPDDAALVAEKIIAALAPAVSVDGGHELHATPSIGVSVFPEDGDEGYVLMKNADAAMYHAKASGRNNFQFFAAKMNEQATRLFDFEHRLRAAVDAGQFLLHYQAVVDDRGRAMCGIAALARWLDPEHGLLEPEAFMPLAEETGLILPLGETLLREACRQATDWRAQGYPALPVSVRLSSRQFRQKNLAKSIGGILVETGQPAKLLVLEIGESLLLEDAEAHQAKLRALAAMGVGLAVADFGSSHSSLGGLRHFPGKSLKISANVVERLGTSRSETAIVAGATAFAEVLGLRLVAEGVSSEAQLAVLREHGCGYFQGRLFGPPLPPEEAAQLFDPSLPESIG